MKWKDYSSIQAFSDKVSPFLLKQEAANNLPLGIIDDLVKNGKEKQVLTATIEDQKQIYASFLMTPPHHLIVTIDPYAPIKDVIFTAIQAIMKGRIEIPSIIGEKETTLYFAKQWSKQTLSSYSIGMKQRIFQLKDVNQIPESPGQYALAEMDDLPLLVMWMKAFIKETHEMPLSNEDIENRMRSKIEGKTLYLWKVNRKPVTMTAKGRQSPNGRVVTLVYTPKEFRGNGYASTLVKKVSEHILMDKSFCTLYTDLANPTSNKIYQNIGYEPVQDSIVLKFN
ncbi:GNAT family N-acetyltransferase [Salinibacillus xinjiangensis]|uniref:GNAT family N-acetyltransferase n=1 Tax=Salinibacillus xinjiangensis TaxID=1229268 RepID=A0A6G1X5R8_9BACI|nr:GNAT family N-acetyltransferase [Salinibacillus xinjiangensis]MRG86282.1 GNAT family N-acetyltransferase [Salinibacillus xinjiangensis]